METKPLDDQRLRAVVTFADNVLEYGRDRYRSEPVPLFADGLDLTTGEHIGWSVPPGEHVVLSNLAAQQNWIRTLCGLTALTGETKYRSAAEDCFRYHFDVLADPSGLLQWGGHRFVDLKTLHYTGPAKGLVHELKNHLPFYEFMFAVDTEAAGRYIEAVWNAHMQDWSKLQFNRHGQYGLSRGAMWDHDFADPRPFAYSNGLSFLNAGNDLVYAAAQLYFYTGEVKALEWGMRMAEMYVKSRHPETGLGVYQYTQPRPRQVTDDFTRTTSNFGDRCKRQLGPDFGRIALEGNVIAQGHAQTIYVTNALVQLALGERLGGAWGAKLYEWTRQGLLAFSRWAYKPEENAFRPLLADGTNLEGYTRLRPGYYGPAGGSFRAYPADGSFLWSYAKTYRLTGDAALWPTVRAIGRGLGLGDLGSAPGKGTKLNHETTSASYHVLYALLELSRLAAQPYLQLAERIGDNMLQQCFHKGWFQPGPGYRYAKFDVVEPLALLALEQAQSGLDQGVPDYMNGSGGTTGGYIRPDGTQGNMSTERLFAERVEQE